MNVNVFCLLKNCFSIMFIFTIAQVSAKAHSNWALFISYHFSTFFSFESIKFHNAQHKNVLRFCSISKFETTEKTHTHTEQIVDFPKFCFLWVAFWFRKHVKAQNVFFLYNQSGKKGMPNRMEWEWGFCRQIPIRYNRTKKKRSKSNREQWKVEQLMHNK